MLTIHERNVSLSEANTGSSTPGDGEVLERDQLQSARVQRDAKVDQLDAMEREQSATGQRVSYSTTPAIEARLRAIECAERDLEILRLCELPNASRLHARIEAVWASVGGPSAHTDAVPLTQ